MFNFVFAFSSISEVDKLHLRMRICDVEIVSRRFFSLSIQSLWLVRLKIIHILLVVWSTKIALKRSWFTGLRLRFSFDFPHTRQNNTSISCIHLEIVFSCGVTAIENRQCSISLHLNQNAKLNQNPYISNRSERISAVAAVAGVNFVKTKSITDLPHYELIAKLL